MFVRKAYRFRLYPSPEQETFFCQITGCCRLVYNLALEQRQVFGRQGRSITWFSQKLELTELRHDNSFLSDIPVHRLQMALQNLDSAFKRFFSGQARYPQPRKKGLADSFCFPDPAQFRLEAADGLLILPKLGKSKHDHGPVAIRLHRPVKGRIKRITISRAGDAWYAALAVEIRAKAPALNAGAPIGIDRGVAVPFALSDGRMLGRQIETDRMIQRQRRLARTISRRKKGSSSRRKAVRLLGRHKAKMARRRRDMIHKITSDLAKNHGLIAIERLRIRNMTASARGTLEQPGSKVAQKSGLNRSILDKGWGEFRRQIAYKAPWCGGRLVEVEARNTSRTCAACGTVDGDSRVTRDRFACRVCGHSEHADTNAGQVILQRALTAEGHSVAACGDFGTTSRAQLTASRSTKQERKAARPKMMASAE
jgi:putative transposase